MIMKIDKFKSLLFPLLILFLSFFSWKSLIQSGFFSMHDYQQIARLQQLHISLIAGQFPVRWVPDLGFGYGYPLFDFYPPFVYYLGELFHLAGLGYIDSIKLIWFVALLGSGFSMYLLSKKFFGRFGGLTSALFYVYAPYHAVDAYVRGALAELFSFVWLPLILLAGIKIIESKKMLWTVIAGLLLGCLMITHNLIFLPFIGFYTAWFFAFTLITDRKNLTQLILFYLLTIVIAFGITGFFWIPSLTLKQYTLVDQLLTKSLASYTIHFVCPGQLWNSLWGYGGSAAGCLDGLSFKVGKIHLVASVMSLLGLIFFIKQKRDKFNFRFSALLISFILLVISLLMTTNYSRLIWDNFPMLWYLQFPWRFLEFAVLFSSLLVGVIVVIFSNTKYQLITATVLIFLLLLGNYKLFVPQYFYDKDTDAKLTSNEEIKWNVSSTSFEYMPKGVRTKLTDKNTIWVDIDKTQIATKKYFILAGDFAVTKELLLPHKIVLSGVSKGGAVIRFSVTNFPGWEARINGQKVNIIDQNKLKLIVVNIDPGVQTIVVDFGDSLETKIGNLVSLTTFLFLLILLYGYTRSKK